MEQKRSKFFEQPQVSYSFCDIEKKCVHFAVKWENGFTFDHPCFCAFNHMLTHHQNSPASRHDNILIVKFRIFIQKNKH